MAELIVADRHPWDMTECTWTRKQNQVTGRKTITAENLTEVTPCISPGWGSNQVPSHWPRKDFFVLCEASMNRGNQEEYPFPTPLCRCHVVTLRQLHDS